MLFRNLKILKLHKDVEICPNEWKLGIYNPKNDNSTGSETSCVYCEMLYNSFSNRKMQKLKIDQLSFQWPHSTDQ